MSHDMWGTPFELAWRVLSHPPMRRVIEEATSIIDAGCGDGVWLEAASRICLYSTPLTGIEWSNELCAEAETRLGPRANIVQCDYNYFFPAMRPYNSRQVVIANPPYANRGVERFLLRSREINSSNIIFLAPMGLLESTTRTDNPRTGLGFYRNLRTVFPLRRVRFRDLSGGGQAGAGSRPCAVYWWQRGWVDAPRLDYSLCTEASGNE